ncbi:hypothetical protein C1H46_020802 [Malus baccata]|uniref:Uncharacterized protein n=1 Tax=Malus baccata TaxID=106549 RepID=A0A540M4B7_MALBA|nr:hypothetical protein C1H46_020802 [Malus baccata]
MSVATTPTGLPPATVTSVPPSSQRGKADTEGVVEKSREFEERLRKVNAKQAVVKWGTSEKGPDLRR